MYLQRLELQGFKSFAQRTVFAFRPPKNGKKGITAIVGPNGSGKSNAADAVRWVLGEQSMKLLRGKKSEDVIFSGSDKKARLGFAEVSLYFNNEEAIAMRPRQRETHAFQAPSLPKGTSAPRLQLLQKEALVATPETSPLDFSEIVITRRLYRDGQSEYLLNNAIARLADIQLLLARAHFGQKTYAVIAQGMIDHMLVASPSERKEFFDEAAGVKEFQLKRHQALLKLEHTAENMKQIEAVVQELSPRVKSLARQAKKFEEREGVFKELRALERQYYGKLWADIFARLGVLQREAQELMKEKIQRRNEFKTAQGELGALEKQETASLALVSWQKQYEELVARRAKLREEAGAVNTKIEIARVRQQAQNNVTPMPTSQMIKELQGLHGMVTHFVTSLKTAKSMQEIKAILLNAETLEQMSKGLIDRLQSPVRDSEPDTSMTEKLEEIKKSEVVIEGELIRVRREMEQVVAHERSAKSYFFALQRQLQNKQDEVHGIEEKLNAAQIEVARLETRRETLESEMQQHVPEEIAAIKKQEEDTLRGVAPDELAPRIYKLRHELEMIGGLDESILKEYSESNERYTFLQAQFEDLEKAMQDTRRAVKELDEFMKERREEALKRLNDDFDKFFKLLFNGGAARLVPVYATEEEVQEAVGEDEGAGGEELASTEMHDEIRAKGKREPVLVGMEIQATPPGKRIKDINILSGGERALTSVAMICAIMANNPSPFVVLDEVDAALDESNSVRFAEIIDRLADKTQFIVITHNRATMHKADILYGVTMGDEGVSRLLSVSMEEAEKIKKK